MAAGFRTPLFILGLSVGIQAGFNGPLPHRGFSGTGAVQAGFQNPLPVWRGGGTPGFIPPEPEVTDRPRGGGYKPPDHRDRILREDEDILAVIMAYMETRH